MGKINILPPAVFNRIAAGEVVERPASIVKELVENSIDANCTSVVVEIRDGGKSLIKISDNGCGIEREECAKAFLPHATSKLFSAEDLSEICSLGFRGEALASIAAVADVEMITKPATCELGTKAYFDDGQLMCVDAGCPDGTYLTVANLFKNIPARCKFLKNEKAEEAAVTDCVSRLILSNPEVAIRFVSDGKKVLQSYGQGKSDAIKSVYGFETLNELISVNETLDGMTLSGFVGRESFTKPNKSYQTFIVNGRTVNNSMLSNAVSAAFGERLMKRQYPFYCLYLNMNSSEVDVNVHPNKLEIRFQRELEVFEFVRNSIEGHLVDNYLMPNIGTNSKSDTVVRAEPLKNLDILSKDFKTDSNPLSNDDLNSSPDTEVTACINIFNSKRHETKKVDETLQFREPTAFEMISNVMHSSVGNIYGLKNSQKEEIVHQTDEMCNFADEINNKTDESISKSDKIVSIISEIEKQKQPLNCEATLEVVQEVMATTKANNKYIGVVFDTYLIVEINSSLYFVDQHAAHERIMYDKLLERLNASDNTIQDLMLPYIFTVNTNEDLFLKNNLASLVELGIDISPFSDNTYKISALPSILINLDLKDFVAQVLSDINSVFRKKNSHDFIVDRLMQQACKSAVKGGENLSDDELVFIIDKIVETKATLMCPHGRPIAVRLGKTEVEKWFKRIVS